MDEEARNELPNTDQGTQSTSAPPSIDPAMLARVVSMLGAIQASTPPTPDQSEASPTPPSGDMLAGLLSNPAMLEKLPQIIAALKPMMEASASAQTSAPVSTPTALTVTPPKQVTDRDNLLLALKPFLSSERREAVDSILRIAKLSELFKTMR